LKPTRRASTILLGLALFTGAARAESWLDFYWVGTDREPDGKILWDAYQIDVDSVRQVGKLISYRTRIAYAKRKSFADTGEQLADCANGEHGEPPDARMHSSYPTTVVGDQVTIACGVAFQRGLVPQRLDRPLIRRVLR
jgi:hypothetical protein